MSAFRWLGAGAVAAALALGLSGCGNSTLNQSEWFNQSAWTEDDSDIARTFNEATVVLPRGHGNAPLTARMTDRQLSAFVRGDARGLRYPTVIYLHGCTGLRNTETLKALARRGFAVIAPDSFSRRYRPLQCRPSRQTGGENRFVFDFRMAEISYALHRMEALPWVDPNRLFLMGTSEGGVAAALYRGTEFRGRVIAQWTCHGGALIRGLAAPADEPVLALVQADDPWYDASRTVGQRGHCGAFMAGRPASQSIVLDQQNTHDVFENPAAMQYILDFLSAVAGRPS